MNNESDLWNCEGYLGSFVNTPNNTDSVFPQFGPYSPSFSPGATLQCTSNSPMVGKCNVTQSVLGIPALVTVGEFCRTPGQPGGQLPTPKEPGDGSLSMTLDPAAIPPGTELSIGYFQNAVRFLLIAKNAPLTCSTGSSQPAYHQSVSSGKIHTTN